jgi:hypothetical protein
MHHATYVSFVTIDRFLQLTNDVFPIVFLHCRRVGQLLLPASLLRGLWLPRLSPPLVTSALVDSTAFFVTTTSIFYVIRTAFFKTIVH